MGQGLWQPVEKQLLGVLVVITLAWWLAGNSVSVGVQF